jgi:hypothetical protein
MAQCANHPNRETGVSCGRCGKPLCPDCVRHGPTGVRCAECLRLPRRAAGLATPEQIARGAAYALIVAIAGGLLLGSLHWVSLWLGALLGFGIGSAAHVGSGRHRDLSVQVVAAAVAALGIVIAAAMMIGIRGGHIGAGQVVAVLASRGFVLGFPAAIIAAIVRFRL